MSAGRRVVVLEALPGLRLGGTAVVAIHGRLLGLGYGWMLAPSAKADRRKELALVSFKNRFDVLQTIATQRTFPR
jgi:hypothetical protein